MDETPEDYVAKIKAESMIKERLYQSPESFKQIFDEQARRAMQIETERQRRMANDAASRKQRDELAASVIKTLLMTYGDGAAAAIRLSAGELAKRAYDMAEALIAEGESRR